MWTEEQLIEYRSATALLDDIMMDVFAFIGDLGEGTNEHEVQEFILASLREHALKMCRTWPRPIVAFGESSTELHHYPSKRQARLLKPGMVIMIDIWGKHSPRHAPFGDITWMGYYGKRIPKKVQEVFALVIKARDASIRFVRRELKKGNLPTGIQVDAVAKKVFGDAGLGEHMTHELGHVIGTYSPHGRGTWLADYDGECLKPGFAYAVEPGIYIEGEFGIRSEVNYFLSPDMRFEANSRLQRDIIHLS